MKELNEIFDEIEYLPEECLDIHYFIQKRLYKIEEYIKELEWELKIKSYSETSLTK